MASAETIVNVLVAIGVGAALVSIVLLFLVPDSNPKVTATHEDKEYGTQGAGRSEPSTQTRGELEQSTIVASNDNQEEQAEAQQDTRECPQADLRNAESPTKRSVNGTSRTLVGGPRVPNLPKINVPNVSWPDQAMREAMKTASGMNIKPPSPMSTVDMKAIQNLALTRSRWNQTMREAAKAASRMSVKPPSYMGSINVKPAQEAMNAWSRLQAGPNEILRHNMARWYTQLASVRIPETRTQYASVEQNYLELIKNSTRHDIEEQFHELEERYSWAA